VPLLTRVYVRTGLIYLAVGALLGGLILWNKGAPAGLNVWRWLAPHISLMTWGWLWHLTLGVAFWILPRFTDPARAGRATSAKRGRVWLAWVAYVCLNASLVLVAATPWLRGPWPNALAGLLQTLAALAFVFHAWPRVRPSAYGR